MGNEAAPPVQPGEKTYRPSGKVYKRTPQGGVGRSDPKFDWVDVTFRNIAEAAQVYADFSNAEVRVPSDLADRPLRFGISPPKGALPGNITYGYVIGSLDWMLPMEGIEIVQLSQGVVAFRAAEAPSKGTQRRRATEREIARYRESLSEERFWQLIDEARQRGRANCIKTAQALTHSLSQLSEDEVLGFELRFEQKMVASYRHDLWAVAYLANGGSSDDGFTYFRAWLIGQGRDRFEAALKHAPDAVTGYSRSFFGRLFDEPAFECEALLYPSLETYQRMTGSLPPTGLVSHPPEPAGVPWREEDLPKLYPELYRRFR